MHAFFEDRSDAGRRLAAKLMRYARDERALVLALPRGGVPVAYEVARELKLPLDLFLVRKLGFPGQEELAMGAIASGGVIVLNDELAQRVPPELRQDTITKETAELHRREQLYRGGIEYPSLTDLTVILVDDGIATGASIRAAIAALHRFHPSRIVIAVPVAPSDTVEELRELADEVVCLNAPEPFYGVGSWYSDFSQTTDEEVIEYLRKANATTR